MENLQAITGFFREVWQIFTLPHPLLGIPYSVIYVGAFAVSFSILILKPILGIGSGVVSDVSSGARRASDSIRAKRRANKANSYESYKKNRDRQTEYASRYRRGE